MRGKYVERRFGWDTHGLPIEALAQDALGISGTHEIKEFGVDKFNEQCRSMVLKYVGEWRKTVTRMGRWVDFDNDYKTMEPGFMESVWWVFKQLWDQGRVYKSHRIMPYSWKLSTPLSNFEAGSNYKDVQDPTVTCRVRATSVKCEELRVKSEGSKIYFLIWTTTPWTLPANLAICAGAGLDYVAVRDMTDDARPVYVMAKARLPFIFKKEEMYEFYNDILTYDQEDSDVYTSKELYVKKAHRFFEEIPGPCTAAQLIRAVYEAAPDDNKTVVLGYVSPGAKMVLFDGWQDETRVELTERDKLIVFTKH
jgi:isoleucyl-tRNA synthetase